MVPKVTNKQLKQNYSYILNCGYCEFSKFKNMMHKIGYNCGVYGWNYSAYELSYNIVLIDGYRSAPSQGFTKTKEQAALKLVKEYNKKIGDVKFWLNNTERGKKKRLFNNLIKKLNKLVEE